MMKKSSKVDPSDFKKEPFKLTKFIENRNRDDAEFLIEICKQQPFKSIRNLVTLLIAIVLFCGGYSGAVVIQYRNYEKVIENRTEELANNSAICQILSFGNFNTVPLLISALLVILYAFRLKRLLFKPNCFWGRPGVPQVLSPFKKTNRFFTSVCYGIITYQIIEIIQSMASKASVSDEIATLVQDPTGLFKFLIRIVEVILLAFRYYPILISLNYNSLFISTLATIYAFIDFANNIYVEGSCAVYSAINTVEDVNLVYPTIKINMIAQVVYFIPMFFLSAFGVSMLSVRLFYQFKYRSANNRPLKKDFYFSKNKLFFSEYDIKYTLDIFNQKSEPEKKGCFKNWIYNWHPYYRFSSRVVCVHIVCFIGLYYMYIFLLETILQSIIPYLEKLSNAYYNVIPFLNSENLDLDLPKVTIGHDILGALVGCATAGLLICLLQAFLGLRSIQETVLRTYRRKDKVINLDSELSKASKSISSIKFAGFTVGYLIWGYLLIFAVLSLVCLIIIIASKILTGENIKNILLKILPILVVFITKYILNYIMGRFVFLQDKGKVLALDNVAFYSVYMYLVFFLDCLIGAISAIIRIIKSAIASLLFLPRAGYCIFGFHLSRFDGGYTSYSGYVEMEVAHSHPVLLTFLGLLMFKKSKFKQTDLETIVTDAEEKPDVVSSKVSRSQRAIRRWHVAYTITRNITLMAEKKKMIAKQLSEAKTEDAK